MATPIQPNDGPNAIRSLSPTHTPGSTPAQTPAAASPPADALDAALGRLSATLNALRADDRAGRVPGVGSGGMQARIDALAAGAHTAAAARAADAPFDVARIDDAVASFRADGLTLAPGERFEAAFEFVQSAQPAGLFLSFGGAQLDLANPTDTFVIHIEGGAGGQELSFASGSSIVDVAAAINAYADATGVRAVASATGVRLEGASIDDDAFVAVKINDDGGIERGDGVHQLASDNWYVAASDAATFESGAYIEDQPRDATILLNGRAATIGDDGRSASVTLDGGATLTIKFHQPLSSAGWTTSAEFDVAARSLLTLVGRAALTDDAAAAGPAVGGGGGDAASMMAELRALRGELLSRGGDAAGGGDGRRALDALTGGGA